jgi:hypothetical protein
VHASAGVDGVVERLFLRDASRLAGRVGDDGEGLGAPGGVWG